MIDPFKVTVRGDGLGLVKANQATSFVISAPAADIPDLDVVITGILCLPFYLYQWLPATLAGLIMRSVLSVRLLFPFCFSVHPTFDLDFLHVYGS